MGNNKYKILIVEDEANIRSFIKANLETSDYQVLCAETCALGIMMYASHRPDLIVLDLGLPDRDGLDLIQKVRESDTVPIIVLSARSNERDKVEALDLGANDYITKPFGTEELLARIRAVLRSHRHSEEKESSPGGKFQLQDLLIDYDTRQVFVGKEEIDLTQTEYNIMYIAALKQCFAMFFLLLALPYAIDKKYVRFYLLVFVAVLFHTHAFMFAIVPLLFGKPWGKVTIAFFGAALFAMATYDATLGAFMEYAQSMGALVAEIEVFDNNAINVLRVAVYWVPALLALVFRKRLFSDSTRAENLFANMSLISAFILMIGLVQAANLFARMAAYFEIATAITLPWMIKKLFTKRSAQYVTACAAVLYFIYFLYEFGVSKGFGSGYSSITLWQFITSLFGG